MTKPFIFPLQGSRFPKQVGEKAKNIHWLYKNGFCIPKTYFIPWDLQNEVLNNGGKFPPVFLSALHNVIKPNQGYAVRSSANVEDSVTQSYAGQFLSMLDLKGEEAVLQAIVAVWASAQMDNVSLYQQHKVGEDKQVKMGVILQEMVPAVFAGVVFSCNPVTGMDEVIIEAVAGSGVKIVQEGVTPECWVWKWGKWLEKPQNPDMLEEQVLEIVKNTQAISKQLGHPIDAEWILSERDLYWLQVRRITVHQEIDIFANHIPKEFLPGLIKPLVWSVNVPLVNGAWVWLLTELIGKNQLDPYRLARRFYGRAYFNMGLLGSVFNQIGLPDNALEKLMGFEAEGGQGPSFRPSLKALRTLPRLILFVIKKMRFHRKIESYLDTARPSYETIQKRTLLVKNPSAILVLLEDLYALNQKTAYYNIVTPLLMRLFHQLAKRQLAGKNIDYTQINWLAHWQDRERYDPIPHLQKLGKMIQLMDTNDRQFILSKNENQSIAVSGFKETYNNFMEQFGHFSDSGNDFSYPSWAERPAVVMNLIEGMVEKPFVKKEINQQDLDQEVQFDTFVLKQAVYWSRRREEISALFTFGIGLFRQLYLRIGDSFYQCGWLAEQEDIFYLDHAEITAAIQEDSTAVLQTLVKQRKQQYDDFRNFVPPPIIYGDSEPEIIKDVSSALKGIAASRGIHRGVVRVVLQHSDFYKVEPGCVLVVPFSDVSWTPLFALAGAVLAEAGGLLSHSSIIAREYGIPAIVSVDGATLLSDGVEVTVDGYTGNIIVHDDTNEGESC
jgi:pyruvate,water dikinase